MTNHDDLIRRGDALAIIRACRYGMVWGLPRGRPLHCGCQRTERADGP